MSSEYKFYGYHQSNGIDPKQTQSSLEMVYETIIQAGLRARAKRELNPANEDSFDGER